MKKDIFSPEMATPAELAAIATQEQIDRAGALKEIRDKIAELKLHEEVLAAEFVKEFPEDVGEHTKTFGKFVVTCKRGETWKWDSDRLEAMFATASLPEYIERKLTVQKRAFQKLSKEDRNRLHEALKIAPGSPSIVIQEVSDV